MNEISSLNMYSVKELEATEQSTLSSSYVTPQMFGAVGDGVNDDTVALQGAVNTGRPVMLLPGQYLITETIDMPRYASITGTTLSIIIPRCETVFNLSSRDNTFSGFSIRIDAEDVVTVFDVNDKLAKQNMWLTIENLKINNNSTTIPSMYTVFHFHSNNGGLAYAMVKDCYIRNNATTGGYLARVYNDADYIGWVSSVHFINCFSANFKWHYFFASDDVNLVNTHAGAHMISNCVAQCTKNTNGFAFWNMSGTVHLTNNKPWDWASSSSGSENCFGSPYVIAANYLYNDNFEKYLYNDGIDVGSLCTYDGETFTDVAYNRVDIALRNGAKYPSNLIPKYISITRAICVRLAKINNVNSNRRIRFLIADANGINYVSIIPGKQKVYSSKPLGSIVISSTEDNKEFYMHTASGSMISAQIGLMSFPVSNSLTGFGSETYANGLNMEYTIDCVEKLDDCMLDAIPEGLVAYTWEPKPTYMYCDDGKAYKVGLTTDAEGNKVIAATYAYSPDSEIL